MPDTVGPVPNTLTAATSTVYTDPTVALGTLYVVVGADTVILVWESRTLWYNV